ncbi:MAG: flavin reductase [Oscillospiraceae bacterium]|nr:flavin reductase [Oscillospiraceae bacterium]
MDVRALFKLSYGLFVLTARENGKDNGCIINTAMQITDEPKQLIVAVNKQNYTHDMIKNTGVFNLSVLSQDAVFWIFQHYGFQSGRDVDKFANLPEARTENGLRYAEGCTNAVISGKVVSTVDCITHTLFVAEVTDAKILSDVPSVTYQYYFDHIKPKPQPKEKKSWVCKICGYVYEGEELPADYICPWCKHGAEAFEEQ